MKNIILLLLIACSFCTTAPERKTDRIIVPEKIKCMILIDEINGSKVNRAGNNYSEEYTASILPENFINSGKETAQKFALKTGINVSESFTGIIDPVIKDYLISELKIDTVILGKIILDSDGKTEVTLKAVNLSDDSTISKINQYVNSAKEKDSKKRLEHALKKVINADTNRFLKNIERHFENRRQR
ncbi:MAG TPA: hypothetical protein PKV85_08450 [Spirochaetota bacterium]|nr:hypothetical protein [Spirochaetota bacterium]